MCIQFYNIYRGEAMRTLIEELRKLHAAIENAPENTTRERGIKWLMNDELAGLLCRNVDVLLDMAAAAQKGGWEEPKNVFLYPEEEER